LIPTTQFFSIIGGLKYTTTPGIVRETPVVAVLRILTANPDSRYRNLVGPGKELPDTAV
jgi:hypothetical protein